jgi:hypothetical protein
MEVAKLFKGHEDLIGKFSNFLSDTSFADVC